MFRAALSGILWLSSWRFTILSYQAFNPRIHATMADIQVNNNSPAFNNKHSKTDQLGKSHTIILWASDSSLCPVKLVKGYIGLSICRRQQSLLTLCNSRLQSLAHFRSMLRKLLTNTGLSPQDHNTHSLHIGATTSAAQEGLSPCIIKCLGRWRSHNYKLYFRRSAILVTPHAHIHTSHSFLLFSLWSMYFKHLVGPPPQKKTVSICQKLGWCQWWK